jgi:DNA-binding transcriptional MerR regulator
MFCHHPTGEKMTTLAFRNLEFVKNLRSSGLTIEQSEAISKGVSDLKEDIRNDVKSIKNGIEMMGQRNEPTEKLSALRKETCQEFIDLRAEMKQEFREFKIEMQSFKSDLLTYFDRFQSNLQKKLMGIITTMVVVYMCLMVSIIFILHS